MSENNGGFMSRFTSGFTQNSNPPAKQQPDQTKQPDQQTTENNSGNNQNDVPDYWGMGSDTSGGNSTQQPNNNGQQTQQTQQTQPTTQSNNPRDSANEFFQRLGLTPFEFTEQQREQINTPEGMQDFANEINNRMQQSITGVVQSMTRVMDGKIQEAVAQAVSKSGDVFNAQRFRETLKAEMPEVADDPVIVPVMETAAANLYKQGKSQAEVMQAIRSLGERFANKFKSSDGSAPNFGGSHRGQAGNSDDLNWEELLTQ